MKKVLKRLLRLSVLFVLTLLIADAALFSLAPPEFLYPSREEKAVPEADAAAVLFHDFADQFQSIDAESARRINHAVSLYRQGRVEYLIMAGGFRPQHDASGARLMARYAAEMGVPPERIVTDGDSLDTRGNLANIEEIMAANNWHSIHLVSSPYHLRRLLWLSSVELAGETTLSLYDPFNCYPPVTRYETWRSAHYNVISFLLNRLLPDPFYGQFVTLVRTHTNF